MTRLSDLALRHATLIIFAAVLLWFGAHVLPASSPPRASGTSSSNPPSSASPPSASPPSFSTAWYRPLGRLGHVPAPLIAGFAMRDLGIGVAGGLVVAIAAGVCPVYQRRRHRRPRTIPFIVTLATLFAFRGFGAFSPARPTSTSTDMCAFGQASLGRVRCRSWSSPSCDGRLIVVARTTSAARSTPSATTPRRPARRAAGRPVRAGVSSSPAPAPGPPASSSSPRSAASTPSKGT